MQKGRRKDVPRAALLLSLEAFCTILQKMGSLLTRVEFRIRAERHLVALSRDQTDERDPRSTDPVTAFRQTKLSGSLRGASKVQPSFGDRCPNWCARISRHCVYHRSVVEPFLRRLRRACWLC